MRVLLTALILLLAGVQNSLAHDSRPLFIELNEAGARVVELKSTAPAAVGTTNAPRVKLAPPCAELRRESADPRRQSAFYDCNIADAAILIAWPQYNPSISTLVRVTFANGETRTAILDPSQDEWRARAPEGFEGVAKSYFKIGVKHIVRGVDHLLFLAGLMIISGTARQMLVTVTGFTIAHSATLALVALGLLRVSVPATEAVIALSIVFLATEIARGDKTTLAWRRPDLVACAFGLVHGAGFAAALGEIGLPKTERLAALLFFNFGVEAGGVAIIAALSAAMFGLGCVSAPAHALCRLNLVPRLAGYALGITSAYWFIERIAVLFAA